MNSFRRLQAQHIEMNDNIEKKQQIINNQRAEHIRLSAEVKEIAANKRNIDSEAEKLNNTRTDKSFHISDLAQQAANRRVEIANSRENYIKSKKQVEYERRRQYNTQLN